MVVAGVVLDEQVPTGVDVVKADIAVFERFGVDMVAAAGDRSRVIEYGLGLLPLYRPCKLRWVFD